MKKEEIYVVIDSEAKQKRAIQILTDAGEKLSICDNAFTFDDKYKFLKIDSNNEWFIFGFMYNLDNEISLDKLEEILQPKEIKLDALKLIAESYGFELVEKKREIKVGDFGKFWDDKDETSYGFLVRLYERYYRHNAGYDCLNFAHLTEQEKAQIQENW